MDNNIPLPTCIYRETALHREYGNTKLNWGMVLVSKIFNVQEVKLIITSERAQLSSEVFRRIAENYAWWKLRPAGRGQVFLTLISSQPLHWTDSLVVFFVGSFILLPCIGLFFFQCLWVAPNTRATKGCQFCTKYDNSIITWPIALKLGLHVLI